MGCALTFVEQSEFMEEGVDNILKLKGFSQILNCISNSRLSLNEFTTFLVEVM